MRAQIKGRPKVSDSERTTLAKIGKRLGRKALQEMATIVKLETVLAWHPRLIAKKFDGSKNRSYPGRPRIDPEVEQLIVQFAKDNRSGGYDRIVGQPIDRGRRSNTDHHRSDRCRKRLGGMLR